MGRAKKRAKKNGDLEVGFFVFSPKFNLQWTLPKTNIAKKASRLLQFHLLLRIHSFNRFGADQSTLAALTPRLRRVAHLAL